MNLYKDKHIYLPLFAVIAVVVGYRAFQDMHPPPRPPRAFFDTYYLVRNDAMMGPFTTDPDDERPLVVDAGDIKIGKDGALTLDAAPVTPITLAQREIILLFTVNTLPKSLDDLGPILTATAGKWKDLGDLVNDIYIKGPKDKKSLGTMLDNINALRESMHNDYWLGLFADRNTLESLPDVQAKVDQAGKSLRTFIINAKDAQQAGEKLPDMIMKIDKAHEMPFILQVDDLPDYPALQQAMKPEPEKFVGFLINADKPGPPSK